MLFTALALLSCSAPSVDDSDPVGPDQTSFADEDADGWPAGPDCDDEDPSVHPGAIERCNGVDDDCSDATIESVSLAAAATPNITELVLCEGVYGANLALTNPSLTIRADGFVTVYARNPALPLLTVEGGEVTLQDLYISGPTYTYEARTPIELEGATLVMRGCNVESNLGAVGGAIHAEAMSLLVLEDTSFFGNVSYGAGGAISLYDSTLEMHGGRITASIALEGGGAIEAIRSVVRLVDVDLVANRSESVGGAIRAVRSSVSVSGGSITGNVASYGGGAIYLDAGDLTAIDTLLEGNYAGTGPGGAILTNASAVDLTSVELLSNATSVGYGESSGGAIAAYGGSIVGSYVLVADNYTADEGGGLLLFETTVEAQGWTIEDNTAGRAGGGMAMSYASFLGDEATLIRYNASYQGGGISASEDSTITGTLVGNGSVLGGGIAAMGEDITFDGKMFANTASAGGGAWLGFGSTLTGTIDWGEGDDDNLPDDMAHVNGATWSSDASGTWTCGTTGCE